MKPDRRVKATKNSIKSSRRHLPPEIAKLFLQPHIIRKIHILDVFLAKSAKRGNQTDFAAHILGAGDRIIHNVFNSRSARLNWLYRDPEGRKDYAEGTQCAHNG